MGLCPGLGPAAQQKREHIRVAQQKCGHVTAAQQKCEHIRAGMEEAARQDVRGLEQVSYRQAERAGAVQH